MTLYDEIVKQGFTTDHYGSDLYVLATPDFLNWIKGKPYTCAFFRCQYDGQVWCEIQFAYSPYWRHKMMVYKNTMRGVK